MINKIFYSIILFVLFLCHSPLKAQLSYYTAWEKRYTPEVGFFDTEPGAIDVDPSGNIIVAGTIRENISNAVYMFLTIKYDAGGNQLWAVKSSLSVNWGVGVNCLKTDVSGNIYIAGQYRNVSSPGSNQNRNGIIIKYNPSGVQQWTYIYDGTSGTDTTHDAISGIDIDKNGNVFFGGYSVVAGVTNFLTGKINSSGLFEWKALIPTPQGEQPYSANSIVLDNNLKKVFVAGWKNIVCYDFNGNELWRNYCGNSAKVMLSEGNLYLGSSNPHAIDIYKLNPLTGNIIWTVFRNASFYGGKYSVDKNGNVFACLFQNIDSLTSKWVTIKYNSSGVQEWEKNSPPISNVSIHSFGTVAIETDDSLNVYIAGKSTIKPPPFFQYIERFTTLIYDKNGNLLQENNYIPAAGGHFWDAGFPLAVNKNSKNFYISARESVGGLPSSYLTINYRSAFLLPAPTNLTAEAVSSGRINLNWEYTSPAPSWFGIERSFFDCSDYFKIDSVPGNITSYIDTVVGPGTPYCYRVYAYTDSTHSAYSNSAIDTTLKPVGILNNLNIVPTEYRLHQNYPNPFNPVTNIAFDLPKSGFVTLKVYDVLGKQVTELLSEFNQAGSYMVSWDASGFPSGIYFYKIESGDFTQVKRMILIK